MKSNYHRSSPVSLASSPSRPRIRLCAHSPNPRDDSLLPRLLERDEKAGVIQTVIRCPSIPHLARYLATFGESTRTSFSLRYTAAVLGSGWRARKSAVWNQWKCLEM